MKIGQTAKIIDNMFPRWQRNDAPAYWNETVGWDKNDNRLKVDGTFIARKYTQIINMVKESNAKVKIEGELLRIVYATGSATIAIDELVTKILIPELSQYIVND